MRKETPESRRERAVHSWMAMLALVTCLSSTFRLSAQTGGSVDPRSTPRSSGLLAQRGGTIDPSRYALGQKPLEFFPAP